VINCTWVISGYGCGPDLQIYYSRDCYWPSHCAGYGWTLTDSSEELVCENIWVPDAPENPGGSGGNDDESEIDDFISEEQQQPLLTNKICHNSFNFTQVVPADNDGPGWKEA